MGHVYQGRYKSFPVETEEYFYQLVRYVERNAYRAKLAKRPDAWRWSSAWRHAQDNPQQRKLLSAWPLPRPRNWNQLLRDPQGIDELDAIRRSVNKGQPFGSENWVKRTAKRLGLESTLRPTS